jgi:hypothetical protein
MSSSVVSNVAQNILFSRFSHVFFIYFLPSMNWNTELYNSTFYACFNIILPSSDVTADKLQFL